MLLPSLEKLDKYVGLGLLRSQTHPSLPLTIYNYTEFATHERLWNNVTTSARGLVVDNKGRCILRCMPKFFNENEPHALCDMPPEKSVAYEKLDGSLIQVTNDPEYGRIVSSKGSFTSDHAGWATEILDERYSDAALTPGLTYVFELIHPENRIVLDYQGERDLYLLTVIENATGIEHSADKFEGFRPVRVISDEELDEYMSRDDVEGLVVKTGQHRYKLKTGNYLRLHRIMTEFTPKRVWEALMAGIPLDFENMPEEFEEWLEETRSVLQAQYDEIYQDVMECHEKTKDWTDKELGLSQEPLKSLLFIHRKGGNLSEKIWKSLKPKEEK